MRRSSLFLLLLFAYYGGASGMSPQPYYNLFGQCRNFYNPAFTAADGNLSAYFIGFYNDQGNYHIPAGIFIRPAYAYTTDVSGALLKHKRHSMRGGISYTRQDLKYMISNTLRLNLAYAFQFSKRRQMMAGLNIDAIRSLARFNYSNIMPAFAYQSANTWNMGCGLAYTSSAHNFYLGTSMTYLRNVRLDYGNSFYYRYHSYFVMQSGIDIRPGKNLVLRPEAILSYRTICTVNSSLTLEYKNRFSLGAIYNSFDQCGPKLGYKTKRFEFNYAWFGYLSALANIYPGTHSLSIRFQ